MQPAAAHRSRIRLTGPGAHGAVIAHAFVHPTCVAGAAHPACKDAIGCKFHRPRCAAPPSGCPAGAPYLKDVALGVDDRSKTGGTMVVSTATDVVCSRRRSGQAGGAAQGGRPAVGHTAAASGVRDRSIASNQLPRFSTLLLRHCRLQDFHCKHRAPRPPTHTYIAPPPPHTHIHMPPPTHTNTHIAPHPTPTPQSNARMPHGTVRVRVTHPPGWAHLPEGPFLRSQAVRMMGFDEQCFLFTYVYGCCCTSKRSDD